ATSSQKGAVRSACDTSRPATSATVAWARPGRGSPGGRVRTTSSTSGSTTTMIGTAEIASVARVPYASSRWLMTSGMVTEAAAAPASVLASASPRRWLNQLAATTLAGTIVEAPTPAPISTYAPSTGL